MLRGKPGKGKSANLGANLGSGAARVYRNLGGKPGVQGSSLAGTLGAGAGTTFKNLRGEPGRNKRYLRGFQSGAAAFWVTLKGTLRVLFLEVSGLMFLSFTFVIVSAFLREYRKFAVHQVGLERVVLAGLVGVMFLYFGVSSFWRARRKRSRI
jgi:hypothetical protein